VIIDRLEAPQNTIFAIAEPIRNSNDSKGNGKMGIELR